jgi:hypothetical protein
MSNHDSLIIPTVQSALVLQGGGALGAYQAGAFRALYEKLIKRNIDILKNTFKISKVVQIQRKDDYDSISGKMGDFTSEIINKWIQEGYHDAIMH